MTDHEDDWHPLTLRGVSGVITILVVLSAFGAALIVALWPQ